MKKLIYLSHPSGGLEENTKDIEKCIRLLYKNKELYNKIAIVSPVHCYGFMYNDDWITYEEGLQFCLDLLYKCDGMIVVGDYSNSRGCKREIEVCKELNIPFICIKDSDYIENNMDSVTLDIENM